MNLIMYGVLILIFNFCGGDYTKINGRCERLRNIVIHKKFKEEFATAEESFKGNAKCTTDKKKTLSCTFSCAKGFLLEGNTKVTCDINGKIIGDIPNCNAKDSCKNPPLKEGETAKCNGGHCIIKCRAGFVRNHPVNPVYNCDTKNLLLDFNIPVNMHFKNFDYFVFNCLRLPTCNGLLPNIRLNGAKFLYYGNVLVFDCKPGFISPANKLLHYVRCRDKWQYEVNCIESKRCSKPPEIEGGTIYGCRANSYEEQRRGIISTCFVKCQENLMHQYSRKIVCNHEVGKWNGKSGIYPKCIGKIAGTCSIGSKVMACDVKMERFCELSVQKATCQQFFGIFFLCICADVPGLDYTPHDIYLNPPSCDWCANGLGPCKKRNIYICSNRAVYDYEQCKCVPKQVHQSCIDKKILFEKTFTNGVVNCETIKESKTIKCSFTCNDDYYLDGPRNWKCDIYGKLSQMGSLCKKIKCPTIKKDPNLLYSCWKKSGENIRCQFRCKDASHFKIKGKEYLECDGRTWQEGRPPNCKMICSDLDKPKSFTCELNKTAQIYTCTIKCNFGYEVYGSKEISCDREGNWSDKQPTCKKWLEKECLPLEATYCNEIYKKRCKGAHMDKCTTEYQKPYKIDCGCHIPSRFWSCPFRKLNQIKGVNCSVDPQTKLWTCLVECFPFDKDRAHFTKTFTCQKNLTWSIIDNCADFWKQNPCSIADRKYCKELHHHEEFCTVEKQAPYRIDCGRNYPRRHWECPNVNSLEGEDRKCENNVLHTKFGDHTLECNFPCTPGDTRRKQGSKSYTCHRGTWWGPEDRCLKCAGVEEKNAGNCSQEKIPCANGTTPVCLLLHESRVSNLVQTCQCECYDFPDPSFESKCSKEKCLKGAEPFCGYFRGEPWGVPFCQCMETSVDISEELINSKFKTHPSND